MGYYVYTQEMSLQIKKDHFDNCYKAMCKLNDYDELKRGGTFSPNGNERPEGCDYNPTKWFSWLAPNYPEINKTFIDILNDLGFGDIEYDDEGNLIKFNYDSKIGQEDLFFNAIAEFITKGSYINWHGEDNELWQWYFNGETMETKYAVIEYK